MGLYEQHKSHRAEHFGIVIENSTNQDKHVQFLGDLSFYNQPNNNLEGINIYPLYKDFSFSNMAYLSMWLMSKGSVEVEITKFQSSTMFQTTKKYIMTLTQTDANGQMMSIPMFLQADEEIPNFVRTLDTPFRLGYYTSLSMMIDKYSDLVVKFFPREKELVDNSFYNKIKVEKDFDSEKRKRITILI